MSILSNWWKMCLQVVKAHKFALYFTFLSPFVYMWIIAMVKCMLKWCIWMYSITETACRAAIYLSAGGCRPGPRCGGARWSGCPSAPCPSSRTGTWSWAAGRGSDSPSSWSHHCYKPPAGRTVGGQKWDTDKHWWVFLKLNLRYATVFLRDRQPEGVLCSQ